MNRSARTKTAPQPFVKPPSPEKSRETLLQSLIRLQSSIKQATTNASARKNSTADVLNNQPKLPDTVVRSKYFAMPPMTVQAALENLELVGHDFYMFRNVETNEINVIYERNHKGYGLLQPRQQSGKNAQNNHREMAVTNVTPLSQAAS